MRLSSLFSILLASVAIAYQGDSDDKHTTITPTASLASLACATGAAKVYVPLPYPSSLTSPRDLESCSLSITSSMDKCSESDAECTCSLANKGFEYHSPLPLSLT